MGKKEIEVCGESFWFSVEKTNYVRLTAKKISKAFNLIKEALEKKGHKLNTHDRNILDGDWSSRLSLAVRRR